MTSTGDKGFVSYGGTDYEVSGPVFQQFKAGYEQSAKQGEPRTRTSRSPRWGSTRRKWLTNAKNAGEAKVGDTDTIKITGDVDVPKLLDDVNAALQKVRAIGGAGTAEPPGAADRGRQAAGRRTRSRTSASRSTPARTTRSCAASSSTMKLEVPNDSGAKQPARRQARPAAPRPQRGARTSRRPRTPSRSTSCSASSSGLGLGGLGALGGASGSGSPAARFDRSAEPREVLRECIQDASGDNAKIAEVRRPADAVAPDTA